VGPTGVREGRQEADGGRKRALGKSIEIAFVEETNNIQHELCKFTERTVSDGVIGNLVRNSVRWCALDKFVEETVSEDVL